jgi:hypothetical protein
MDGEELPLSIPLPTVEVEELVTGALEQGLQMEHPMTCQKSLSVVISSAI